MLVRLISGELAIILTNLDKNSGFVAAYGCTGSYLDNGFAIHSKIVPVYKGNVIFLSFKLIEKYFVNSNRFNHLSGFCS